MKDSKSGSKDFNKSTGQKNQGKFEDLNIKSDARQNVSSQKKDTTKSQVKNNATSQQQTGKTGGKGSKGSSVNYPENASSNKDSIDKRDDFNEDDNDVATEAEGDNVDLVNRKSGSDIKQTPKEHDGNKHDFDTPKGQSSEKNTGKNSEKNPTKNDDGKEQGDSIKNYHSL